MKFRRLSLIVVAVVMLAPAAFAAQFGIRAGRINDSDTNFVGAEVNIPVGMFNINPNFEYWTDVEDATAGTANVDVTLDLGKFPSVQPYIGAGVGMFYVDTDAFGSDTTTLGNLIGGVKFHVASLTPYAQAKYFRAFDEDVEGDDWALTIGLRF